MSVPRGVVISADTISADGESQGIGEYIITLEDGTVDIRLKDDEDTIVMLNLPEIEEALRTLKRWERDSS
jgi:hypothetical protein